MRNFLLSVLRHGVAAAVGALVGWLTDRGVEVSPEDAEGIVTAVVGFATLIGYAAVEKGLKPLWFRWFGELQPGEVPPATHDQAKAKEGVS